jgi:hypothetical protein
MTGHAGNDDSNEDGKPRRSPYRTPELIEYGPVAKLTQGTLTTMNDSVGGGMSMMMMCL